MTHQPPKIDWTKLKYYSYLRSSSDFPPHGVERRKKIGFRFVNEDLYHKDNFLPVAFISSRPRPEKEQSKKMRCGDYALSMFSSAEELARKAKSAKKSAPNFLKRVGDHFAKMMIDETDGICEKSNKTGHFNFYEDENFDGIDSVSEHKRLMP